ncbi:TIM21 domain-containing protein [Ditylenchus destructor]|nr:TIM21 domain-containing protein [Ditylenchus destructor]
MQRVLEPGNTIFDKASTMSVICRARLPLYLQRISRISILALSSPACSSNLQCLRICQFTTGSQPPTKKELKMNPDPTRPENQLQRSVLEEILIEREEEPKTTAGKIKKGTVNTIYISIAAVSVAIIGAIAYFLVIEMFKADSPTRIYSKALKMIKNDDQCIDLFGSSIKGFGEDSGRGRRRHVASKRWTDVDGNERVRVMFHIKGDQREGQALAEMIKKEGQWDYRFLYASTPGIPPVMLIDNR